MLIEIAGAGLVGRIIEGLVLVALVGWMSRSAARCCGCFPRREDQWD